MFSSYRVGAYAPSEGSLSIIGRQWKSGNRGIVMPHGAGGSALYDFPLPTLYHGMVEMVGWPLLKVDAGGPSTYGNATSVAALHGGALPFITHAVTGGDIGNGLGAKAGGVIVIGWSMGALCALQWAKAYPNDVKAILLYQPVVSLQHVYADAPALDAAIDAAWPPNLASNLAVADPLTMGGATWAAVPMQIWYSATQDVIIRPTDVLAFGAAQGTVPKLIPGDPIHGVYQPTPGDVNTFLLANA